MDLPYEVKNKFYKDSFVNSVKKTKGLTVIIPIRGKDRNPSLIIALDYILLQNIDPIEILVIEESQNPEIKLGKHENNELIKYYYLKGGHYFNKSKCINYGICKSAYFNINMNDVDIVIPFDYYKEYFDKYSSSDMLYLSKQIYFLDKVPDSIGDLEWSGSKWWDSRKFDFVGGNFFINKEKFINIGGMDENFQGYGCEDGEFYTRATKIFKVNEVRNLDFPLLHMPHINKIDNNVSINEKYYSQLKKNNPILRIPVLKNNLMKYV